MKTTKKSRLVTLIAAAAAALGAGAWPASILQANDQPGNNNEWDPFVQIERMQEEIDRVIRRAAEELENAPNTAWFHPSVGYSSSFDLRDRGDRYEMRVYLPDAKASDVKVQIDNDRTLRVSVTQRKEETKKSGSGSASFKELGEYEQVVTLPEPVRSADMKIDRRDHEVVIKLPKAAGTV
jgi:HSP20 family molecular chaperone IbpA